MNKAELKQTLDKMNVEYGENETNKELEAKIEANNNPDENYTTSEGVVSGIDTSDISDAPDPTEAPGYIGTADLKSQDLTPSDSVGSEEFIDPNWGDK